MSTGQYDGLIGDTLAMVNMARMAFGKEPLNELPDAVKSQSSDCLFFRALADCGVTGVGNGTMSFDSERTAGYIASLWGTELRDQKTVQSPSQFREIISAFDNGNLEFYSKG